MSAKFEKMVKDLSETIKNANQKKTSSYDTRATVKRVEGGTAYVHIPGGVDETPVEMTVNAVPGDSVQVRVGGGRAWITGNGSAPPTDDKRANQSYLVATEADKKAIIAGDAADAAQRSADAAQNSANIAHQAAQSAQTSANEAKTAATNATTYANRALVGLSTVESVVDTLTWITQHGTMTLTTDTAIDPAHVYFVLDTNGDYVVGNVHYSLVTEPQASELSTYYELSIDDSVNNYVATHLAVTEDGLWLLPAAQGTYKVLVATGAGSNYPTAGTYIVGPTSETVASFRADGFTIGEILSEKVRVDVTTGGMQIIRRVGNNDVVIANIGYGVSAGQSGSSNAPYYTFGERRTTTSAYSSSTTYSLGDLAVYDNKVYVYINANSDSGHSPDDSDGSSYWRLTVGTYSFAEGLDSVASGHASHAEGMGMALNHWAHGEGYDTIASGQDSHSEGYITVAQGEGAHSEGIETYALGDASHSEGKLTHANHDNSHASGFGTRTSRDNQTVVGEHNANDSDALFIVGNGNDTSNRSNAMAVRSDGSLHLRDDVYADCNTSGNNGIKLSGVGFTSSGSLLRVETLYISCNNAAHTIKTVTPAAITGYSVVGIIGWAAAGDFPPGETIYELSYDNSNNVIRIGWQEAISSSYGVNVKILYVKS